MDEARRKVNIGLAEMLCNGVVMDVMNVEQARIAEDAGACAVMALERIPSEIRKAGGVSRMSDPDMILKIKDEVSIPVMAKVRIGHFAEAQILQEIGIDFIDESEVLSPADDEHHVDKWTFDAPFVCGACNLGEALRRVGEGACLIRTKGEAGTGNIVEGVRHMRSIQSHMKRLTLMDKTELYAEAKNLQAPLDLVQYVAEHGKLPVPNFAAGGGAIPADAALLMQLGAESVFVGSGIFTSESPEKFAAAIVKAVTHYNEPAVVAEVSRNLGDAMRGISMEDLANEQKLADRGW